MVWNTDNTSVNDHWGSAPTFVYPLNLELNLNIVADSIRVHPLDTTGKENLLTSFVVKPVNQSHFLVKLDQSKYKTTWFGIEKCDKNVSADIIVDGSKDEFYSRLTGPDDGYVQMKSYAFNDNGIPTKQCRSVGQNMDGLG